jgi:hypothetical protein
MHILRIGCLLVLVIMLSVILSGCPFGIAPGSRAYQPLPKWEARFYAEARRDIFPNDVRPDPNKYAKTLLAWTGVITNIDYHTENDGLHGVKITAEHHYFDWIEDSGIQREVFFLSPRGEGMFAACWWIEPNQPNAQKFVDQFAVGDMLIAYGYPSMVRNNVIELYPTQNMRAIKPKWYRTDILDYGRHGEPSKVLKVAF